MAPSGIRGMNESQTRSLPIYPILERMVLFGSYAYRAQHTGVACFQWTTFSEREPDAHKQQIPALFWFNAFLIASNGTDRPKSSSAVVRAREFMVAQKLA